MCIYLNISWDQSEQKACQRHATSMPRKAADKSKQQASNHVKYISKISWGKSEQKACQRHVASMHVEAGHPILHVRRAVKTAAMATLSFRRRPQQAPMASSCPSLAQRPNIQTLDGSHPIPKNQWPMEHPSPLGLAGRTQ